MLPPRDSNHTHRHDKNTTQVIYDVSDGIGGYVIVAHYVAPYALRDIKLMFQFWGLFADNS